jgi:hypothetical protein
MSDRLENLMSRASELVVPRYYLEPCATGRGVQRQENNWKEAFCLMQDCRDRPRSGDNRQNLPVG